MERIETAKALYNGIVAMLTAMGHTITEEFDEESFMQDEFTRELDAEDGKPTYLLCDEIWDILAEAGHGCEVIIHKESPETIYYNDFASQADNIRFMNHLSEAMDNGYHVTVNGTNIFDLY